MKKIFFILVIVLALALPQSSFALSCVPPSPLEDLIEKPDPYTHVFYGEWEKVSDGEWNIEIKGAWVWPKGEDVPHEIRVRNELHPDWPFEVKSGEVRWVAATSTKDGSLGVSQCSPMGDDIGDLQAKVQAPSSSNDFFSKILAFFCSLLNQI